MPRNAPGPVPRRPPTSLWARGSHGSSSSSHRGRPSMTPSAGVQSSDHSSRFSGDPRLRRLRWTTGQNLGYKSQMSSHTGWSTRGGREGPVRPRAEPAAPGGLRKPRRPQGGRAGGTPSPRHTEPAQEDPSHFVPNPGGLSYVFRPGQLSRSPSRRLCSPSGSDGPAGNAESPRPRDPSRTSQRGWGQPLGTANYSPRQDPPQSRLRASKTVPRPPGQLSHGEPFCSPSP